ncbi:MAG: efflux RND transporter permease subunit, partial [Acidobacteriota bacterium]
MSDVREQDVTAMTGHPAADGPAGRLAALFVDSKLTPLLVVAALILGLVAIGLTPREEEPQIVVPVVDLFVGLPGADPAEVESRVTLPLEKRMWEIPGVEYVYSASMPGFSMVTVRFYVGDDAERSLIKVYDQLAGSLDQIPTGATPPLVRSRAIDDVPIFGLTLWSPDGNRSGAELRRYAGELGRQLAALDEVSDIRVIGGERRQVRIHLDPARLSAAGLDPTAVEQAITVQNAAAPAGAFEADGREVLVETGAFLRSVDEVAALVVGVTDGGGGARRPIRLDDVATVEDATEDVASYVLFRSGASFDGEVAPPLGAVPAVTLTLAKRRGADAHRVAEAALARVETLRGEVVPRDVELTITRDYGATADEKASELLVHLGVAVASVTLVLGFFLGWRGALVVFVSVPVSFALTLFVYYVFGYTLNRVTLFALIFVTGIVVDDSIIVVENIVRHLAMKTRRPLDAALHAVSEVGNPTILATLTVIASVLPMAFVRGLMGPYMSPMPVGASLAMAFSLFVALIATPWFAYRLFKGHTHDEDARDETEAIRDSRIYRTYARILRPLLDSRVAAALFLAATFVLLIGSMLLVPGQGVALKMLPFDNKSELQVLLDLPEGTTLETTARVAREVADRLAEEPEVTDLQLYVGTAAPINFNGLVRHYDLRRGSHVADLQVNFLHKKQRSTQSHDLAKRLRPSVVEIAERHGAAAKVVEVPPGPPVLSTLVAEVYGPSEAER